MPVVKSPNDKDSCILNDLFRLYVDRNWKKL